KDEVFISESGLYSMAGGKLTGYRKMAEGVVDQVTAAMEKDSGIIFSKLSTEHTPISGGAVGGSAGIVTFKLTSHEVAIVLEFNDEQVVYLIQLYGSNVDIVFELYEQYKATAAEGNIEPVVLAMLEYALQYEAVYKPVDFFIRRTAGLFFNYDWVIT